MRNLISEPIAQKTFPISGNQVFIAVSPRGLTEIRFLEKGKEPPEKKGDARQEDMLAKTARQLEEYYAGSRRIFDIPIDWSILSPFRKRALQAAACIPYGSVITYRALAKAAGNPAAARAAGGALAHNPWGIIVPCHRVVGADGALHGFSAPGGLESKARLLRHEGLQVKDGKVKISPVSPSDTL